MRVVLDTNVILSAALVGGVTGRILDAWRNGALALVACPEVLDEYRRAGLELERRYPGVRMAPFLRLVEERADIVELVEPIPRVSRDRDDDKFLACARAGGAAVIVSGDKDLQSVSGHEGIEVLSPRAFADRYLA